MALNIKSEIIREKLELLQKHEETHNIKCEKWRDAVHTNFSRMDDNHQRWMFSVFTLSSAILGFGAISFLKADFIHTVSLVYVAMALFALLLIIGLFRLKCRVEKGMNELLEQARFINKLNFDGLEELRDKIVQSGGNDEIFYVAYGELQIKRKDLIEKNDAKRKASSSKVYTADFLLTVFVMGIIMLGLSFTNIGDWVSQIVTRLFSAF